MYIIVVLGKMLTTRIATTLQETMFMHIRWVLMILAAPCSHQLVVRLLHMLDKVFLLLLL